jgi:NitT/TauT family transport system permease protein
MTPATSRVSERVRVNAWRLAVVIAFLAIWEIVARLGLVAELFISKPSTVFLRLVSMLGEPGTYYNFYITFFEAIAAWALGAIVGLVIGYVLGVSHFLDEIFRPLFEVANAVPKIVLAPLFILWFGLGPASKVAFGFALVVFIVYFNVYAGLRSVDQDLIKKAKVLGASSWQVNRYVLLPSVMSWFLSSLRISFAFALAAAIVGEFIASARGMGVSISHAAANFDTGSVFAGLILLSAGVFAIAVGLAKAERWFLRWRPEQVLGRPVF